MSEDNLIVIDDKIFILTDGSGDLDNGYRASKIAVDFLSKNIEYNHNLLEEKVKETYGFTTITYMKIEDKLFKGFYVGDSSFYFFSEEKEITNITNNHKINSLVGNNSIPISFEFNISDGIGIIASKGLWKFLGIDIIESIVYDNLNIKSIKNLLIDNVRIGEDHFGEDISIIIFKIS